MLEDFMIRKYITNSAKETKNLAKKIAKNFDGGKVLALSGELGAGKTHFTKGLAEYFKVSQTITSPTFVLMKPYKTGNKKIKQLVHVDCYRLDSEEELQAIGLEEYFDKNDCLTVIEWAEKVKSILSNKTIWIKFKLGRNENQRIIEVGEKE